MAMFRKLYLSLIFSLVSIFSYAQTGTLKGVITNTLTGEPIPFANLIIEKNGNQTGGTATDFDGNYTIKPVDPGTYSIKVTCVGFGAVEITGVIVSANKITFQDVKLQEGIAIGEIKIIEYKKPLLDQDNLSGETKTSEEIVALPTRSVASVAASTAGIYQQDEGDDVNIRGSRDNATTYYIDGIKVRGAKSVPTSGIEQITVVTGGLSAQYGDATGGIISITTKGPSNKTFGAVEYETSSLFDNYNYNLLGWTLSGPILKKRDKDGKKGSSIIGYFLSGELRSVDDNDPSAIGIWKIKDSKLQDLQNNPLQFYEEGGIKARATFLDEDDFENVQAKMNADDKRITLSGKLDFKPANNTFLSLGGSYFAKGSNDYSRNNSMMNWENNRYSTENTYRFFGKLTQKFGADALDEDKNTSTIKNIFLTIQGDYTNYSRTFSDPDNSDELFKYGYVGKFNTYKAPIYEDGVAFDPVDSISYEGQILSGFSDTLLTFDPSNLNPSLVNYTNSYYNLFSQEFLTSYSLGGAYGADGVIRTQDDLRGIGLLNGESPASVYSLYANNGDWYPYFAKDKKTQTSFKASGSADIGSHEFSFGFEFEQRNDSYWQFNGFRNIWQLMRQQTNKHILELDLSNPIPVESNGIYQDTVNYPRLVIEDEQSFFDKKLRDKLISQQQIDIYGNPIGDDTWIDVDAYDPSFFSLDMFSPDELLNNSSEYVFYYGYDIYGNKLSTVPTLKEFFEGVDDNGEKTRKIAPFQPIYTAGYIQDKFAIEDLIFNVGLRIDRYDANQKVLKDKYLLYPAYTVDTELSASDVISTTNHPSNIGGDYVVYVDDVANPSTIVGYRNGDDWYDSGGRKISDPTLLSEAAGGSIAPYLGPTVASEAINNNISADAAFEDYTPEIIFMPRIAFSFPISDEAQFFAHYDVLTQRPPGYNRLDPVGYLFLANDVGATLNNPDLKPERTIDYELGFAKTLSLKSALKISAFYKELRDMITKINVISAYPQQYYTFGNLDFGTVKGMSISYDLRRTNNVQLTANYTLQFADGTGSETDGSINLVETGQPNLRTTIPLDFDQRHALSASVDYRYGSGKDYNGPVWFGTKIFENSGANIRLDAGSGTPYSRQSNITQEAAFGINDRSTLSGSLNGSRLPWQFKMSAKINKEFEIKWSDKKSSFVNVYLQVQNLLNAENVISVYRATGNPEDDGYLTASASQNAINAQNDPEAFRTLYTMKVNNPSNYALPRMFRAGLSIEF